MAEGVAGGTEAAGAGGTVRAASPGWPGRSGSALNQDSSQPSSSEHEMSSGCSAEEGVAQVGGREMQPLLPWTGGGHSAGGSSSSTG